MKAMILRRNDRGRGLDVGWRYGDGAGARELFWATVPDVAALRELIAHVAQLGEPFTPPSAATIVAAAGGDARILALRVLRSDLTVDDTLHPVACPPPARP